VSGHHREDLHLSKNGRLIEHEIEHKLAKGHTNVQGMLYDEVQKLRRLDSSADGKVNKHKFSHDVQSIEAALHHKHLLPHLHLPKDSHNHSSEVPLPPRRPDDLAAKGSEPTRAADLVQPAQKPDLSPAAQKLDLAKSTRKPDLAEPSQKPDLPPAAPESQPGSGNLSSLSAAIARAKAGGRPVNIVQIGDSHIDAGIETPALAKELAADNGLRKDQVKSSFYGRNSVTSEYANEHSAKFLNKLNKNTDLVVVSFGTNDAKVNPGNDYTKNYSELIAKVHDKAPNASIVMVGPTDGNFWNTDTHLPYLNEVTQAQERVAAATRNSAYINVLPQMGPMANLRRDGFMTTDRVHLTGDGYRLLGKTLGDDISAELKK
jgi:lysophospholipase L1-like esterase